MKKTVAWIGIGSVIIISLLWISLGDQLGIREIPLEILQQKYETKDSRYVTIENTRIHYVDQGKGPTVVALHGIADSLHTWDSWAQLMTDTYRVVRLDLPGFGLTGPNASGDYSKEMFIRVMDRFLDELSIDKTILVGNSLGGAIAWNYALQHPERVTSLVLIDPAGYPLKIPFPLSLAEIPGIRHLASHITPRFIFSQSLKQVFGDPSKVTDALVDQFYELSLRPGNREALMHIMTVLGHLSRDPSFSRSISNLTTRTLLLWGKQDRWIPPAQAAQWQRDVTAIDTVLYENVGHVPQLEIPEQVAADIKGWLGLQASGEGEAVAAPVPFVVPLAGLCVILAVLIILRRKRKPV